MKKCSNCFKLKALTSFYVKRGFGHQSRCKDCNAEVVRGYRERAKGRATEELEGEP